MSLGISGVGSRNVTHLHLLNTGQDRLDSPSSKLGAVVLHLASKDSTLLSVEILPPVKGLARTTLDTRVILIEGLDSDEDFLLAKIGVSLGSENDTKLLFFIDGKVELPVLVQSGRRRFRLDFGRVERVGVGGIRLRFGVGRDLRREVVRDVGGLEREGTGRINVANVIRVNRGVGGVLVDGDVVERPRLSLVEKDLTVSVFDDDIPRVYGSTRTHEDSKDRVSCKNLSLFLFGVLDTTLSDWIFGE